MFFSLALVVFGLAWLLRALGVYSIQTFGLVGAVLVIFAGLLRMMNLKKGRKVEDGF